MTSDGPPWVSNSGAVSSKKAARFDLLPLPVMECLSDRLEGGLLSGNGHRWKLGLSDYDFIVDRTNHMQWHLTCLMQEDLSEDDEWGHVGAILFGCMVRACAIRANGIGAVESLTQMLAGLAAMKEQEEKEDPRSLEAEADDLPF